MLGIIIAFVLGIIISGVGIVPYHFYRHLDKVLTGILLILLFGMGLNIGLDEKITGNILELGKTAFLISAGSVIGSVLLAWYFGKLIYGEKK